MPFSYTRTVRFKDTDAAGVVYLPSWQCVMKPVKNHWLYRASISRYFLAIQLLLFPLSTPVWIFSALCFAATSYLLTITKQRSSDEFEIGYKILEAAAIRYC